MQQLHHPRYRYIRSPQQTPYHTYHRTIQVPPYHPIN